MKTVTTPNSLAAKAAARLAPEPSSAVSEPAIRIKDILVPVDFSACSKKALAYAVAFARQFQAAVTLLHVVDFQVVGADRDIDVPQVKNTLRLGGERQLARLVREAIGHRVLADTLVRTGQPFVEIVEAARTRNVDLIVMATHGNSGISRFLVGSTTERVVRHAPCPVLIVREREHEFVSSDIGLS